MGWDSQAACNCRPRAGAWNYPSLQTQTREDPLYDGLLQDRHDDLELAAAVPALLKIELTDANDRGRAQRVN